VLASVTVDKSARRVKSPVCKEINLSRKRKKNPLSRVQTPWIKIPGYTQVAHVLGV
jgi:hypothetical protein